MVCKIVVLGDFNPDNSLHHAVNASLEHAGDFLQSEFAFTWIATDEFDPEEAFDAEYSGLWIVPGSPYKSMEGVLAAIRYARENDVPILGTCAGFQHMLIEIARNVGGLNSADHEETASEGADFIISRLACSLVGRKEMLFATDFASKTKELLPDKHFIGQYHCNFALNPDFVELLESCGCIVTVVSELGEVRAFELKSHPYFVGTLFQAQLDSEPGSPSPLVLELLNQSLSRS